MQITADALQVAKQEIKQALNLLSELFNIRTAFLYGVAEEVYQNEIAGQNGAFRPYCQLIQRALKHKCFACDADKFRQAASSREPLLYRCYNGLYEMYLPLHLEGFLVGYLHFGQVRSEEDFALIRTECGLNEHSQVEELERHYQQMEVVPKEKLRLIAQLFKQLATHLLHHKLIALRKARPEYFLKQYIEENLAGSISIQAAAGYIGRSVSFVTHQFKQFYGCSFLGICAELPHGEGQSVPDKQEYCRDRGFVRFQKPLSLQPGVQAIYWHYPCSIPESRKFKMILYAQRAGRARK
jgi:ligand-binding sensor protein